MAEEAKIENNFEDEETQTRFKKRKVLIPLLVIITAVLGGLYYFIHSSIYVSTDDAYIVGHNIQISPKVAGYITGVYFDDNQQVEKGQLLVEIEPNDYQVKYEQATASIEAAKSQEEASRKQITQAQVNLAQINSDIESVKSEFNLAKTELDRYTKLYAANAASKQDFDRISTNYQTIRAKLDSYTKKAAAAQEQISVNQSLNKTSLAQIKQSQANAKQAKLNLSYTKVYAPETGTVTSKAVEEGVYVQTGQPLFSIIPEKRWIIANFKETQLTRMKPGQVVIVKIDAYPNKEFRGKVDSIQQSTGSVTSMFPPENAVGSFVKIVQRVPVKIVFTEKIDSQYNIVPGMSVIPEVKVK